jgi:arsenate reductase
MSATSKRTKVLFLCTGNSCRSQIAEGYARALKADVIEAFSAGIVAHGQNPNAITVMAEDGVDITTQQSKTLQSLLDAGVAFDVVYTVCGHADENCPVFPGATKVVHQGFDDPPKLAKDAKNEEESLNHYRRVRDEIRAWIKKL